MNQPAPLPPYEASPPSSQRLWKSIVLAAAAAAVILVLFVLPAEYGIDPTGAGRAMGLTAVSGPTRTLQIKDVIGGNENFRDVALPDVGEPTPLPNPAVAQIKAEAPQMRTVVVKLGPNQETEVKTVLDEAQVILYSWKAEGGDVYVDFHGHQPGMGKEFVRYEEQQQTTSGHGSLVAPFAGEHGWFWLNLADAPVTITLQVSGYYKDIVDYGIIR
ncbi:MAG: hypothetical protein QM696_07740 [Steroidobacteraceae bacterium]